MHDELEEEQRSFGHVMIAYGTKDIGYWFPCAEVSVADEEELEEILKRLEGVIKRAVAKDAQEGEHV